MSKDLQFYQQGLTSLFQVKEKLKTYKNSKQRYSSGSSFSHIKIAQLKKEVSSEYDKRNFPLAKSYSLKVRQNYLASCDCSNEINLQFFKFQFTLNN